MKERSVHRITVKKLKKGKKGAAKYGKKRNISKAEFAGVKKTRQYKADLKKVLAKSPKEEEETDVEQAKRPRKWR